MYKSELHALNTNKRMHPFRKPGRTLIPARVIATTNGEAEAELVVTLLAKTSFSES
jgi:hypothetical protein